jgi:hypothetical protein
MLCTLFPSGFSPDSSFLSLLVSFLLPTKCWCLWGLIPWAPPSFPTCFLICHSLPLVAENCLQLELKIANSQTCSSDLDWFLLLNSNKCLLCPRFLAQCLGYKRKKTRCLISRYIWSRTVSHTYEELIATPLCLEDIQEPHTQHYLFSNPIFSILSW